jgi:hypothetical protein
MKDRAFGQRLTDVPKFVMVGRECVPDSSQTNERIHLRHHPSRQLKVFADSIEEALQILAYEFHLWEVRESVRLANQRPPWRLRKVSDHHETCPVLRRPWTSAAGASPPEVLADESPNRIGRRANRRRLGLFSGSDEVRQSD